MRTALILAGVLAFHCASALPQGNGQTTPQSADQASQVQKASNTRAEKDQALELLIRKYTSDASLGGAGHVQFVWLNPELIDAVLDRYGEEHSVPANDAGILKTRLAAQLHTSDSLAFLVIFKPGRDGLISGPFWTITKHVGYPDVHLRGSGGQREPPYKWSQILGDGEFHWYSGVTWGYLLFKASSMSGSPMISQDEFAFSVELIDAAETSNGALYDTTTDFTYDLMPIQLQSLVDSSLPSWNNSLVQMREQRDGHTNYSDDGTPAQGYDANGKVLTTQNNATALSHSEILQISGLALQFAEFLLK